MNLNIPFTKDIDFKGNIAEIISISLEHEFTTNDTEILGNFIVTGEYKSHEVSVNKEHFEHVLPFSVSITSKIDQNSVDLEIKDFTYEIIDNETLRVNIEYSIKADSVLEESMELNLDSLLNELEEERQEEIEETKDREVTEESVDSNVKDTILSSINEDDDAYVTYKIHVYQETDTVESICLKYNTSKNILEEYNDLGKVETGDKLIIPEVDE